MEFQSTLQLHIRVIFSTIDGTPEEEGEVGERNEQIHMAKDPSFVIFKCWSRGFYKMSSKD